MNVVDHRRENLRTLAKSVGGLSALAEFLCKSQSQISHVIGKRPIKNIGHSLAKQIEQAFNKPGGWLDLPHLEAGDAIEQLYDLYLSVPLIEWKDVPSWNGQDADRPVKYEQIISTHMHLGKLSFALKVRGDSMESGSGLSFPDGCIVIIDPEHEAKHNSFVVASDLDSGELTFKQLIVDGNQRYLKPLNTRYPMQTVGDSVKIYGVTRQMLVLFE